jgi:hypothetical protein
MDRALALDRALSLLGGELRDASGARIAAPTRPVRLLTAGDAAGMTAAIASGARVAVAVSAPSSPRVSAATARLASRLRIARARSRLVRAGATRVRTLAVVPGRDDLFVVYELGGTAQPYVEERMILRAREAPWRRAVKSVVRLVTGVDAGVELLVVVGERA